MTNACILITKRSTSLLDYYTYNDISSPLVQIDRIIRSQSYSEWLAYMKQINQTNLSKEMFWNAHVCVVVVMHAPRS
jgi:L-rhamnose mutarotase